MPARTTVAVRAIPKARIRKRRERIPLSTWNIQVLPLQAAVPDPKDRPQEGRPTVKQAPNSRLIDIHRNNGKPSPKIHDHSAPHPDSHSAEVKAHNEEMDRRHGKAQKDAPGTGEKVDKSFWKGKLLRI